jgi:hypothetical protein
MVKICTAMVLSEAVYIIAPAGMWGLFRDYRFPVWYVFRYSNRALIIPVPVLQYFGK